MPLPDERPQQRVANLIGRWEQKGQSLSGTTPPLLPRSTSVASHITGDSVKEEIREKREWPPRSFLQDEKPKMTIPSSTIVHPLASQPTLSPAKEAAAPSFNPVAEDPAPPPVAVSESAKTPKSLTTGAKSSPVRKPASTPIKTPAPRASSTAKRSPVRSPPTRTSALNTPSSQPLRPQHTGTSSKSVTSPPSSTRHIKSGSKSAQSTPNHPKTPASSYPSRPKTPSGLFAPTAASLAKARIVAVPAVPTPIKKTTLSSGAAERLSKPTAASISKVRTPSLPGGGKVTARGAASTSTIKPRTALAPAKAKETVVKRNGNGVKRIEAAAEVGSEAKEGQDTEPLSDEGLEDEHDLDASGILAEPESVSFVDESAELIITESEDVSHELANEGTYGEESGAEVVKRINLSPTASPALAPEDSSHELEAEPVTEDANPTGPQASDEPITVSIEGHLFQETKTHQAGTEIHDIVNLLESAPAVPTTKVRPISIIPDDAPDIPDEE